MCIYILYNIHIYIYTYTIIYIYIYMIIYIYVHMDEIYVFINPIFFGTPYFEKVCVQVCHALLDSYVLIRFVSHLGGNWFLHLESFNKPPTKTTGCFFYLEQSIISTNKPPEQPGIMVDLETGGSFVSASLGSFGIRFSHKVIMWMMWSCVSDRRSQGWDIHGNCVFTSLIEAIYTYIDR